MHAITITFPSFVKTFIDSCFHDLVFQDRWSKREVNGIFLFITINEHILLSIASMVSSKVWFFHFPLLFVIATLITHGLLWFGCMLRWDLFFSNACWSNTWTSFVKDIQIHDYYSTLGRSQSLQQVDGVCCDLTNWMPFFCTNPSNTKNQVEICLMCIIF